MTKEKAFNPEEFWAFVRERAAVVATWPAEKKVLFPEREMQARQQARSTSRVGRKRKAGAARR